MKIALTDLEQALQYFKQNSNDVYCALTLQPGHLQLVVGNPDGDVVTVKLYDMDSAMQAKVTSEQYLRYLVANKEK